MIRALRAGRAGETLAVDLPGADLVVRENLGRGSAAVVDALCAADAELLRGRPHADRRGLPSRDAVAGVIDDLRAVLFPSHFGGADLADSERRRYVAARLGRAERALAEQVRRGLSFTCDHLERTDADHCDACDDRADEITGALVGRLPAIRATLQADIEAAFAGDPAATFIDETLLCYPGITAITFHRVAHPLHVMGVPLIPRIISELGHRETGIDIHPGARIGPSFFIDHGTGVVVGETCTIGRGVRLYQGVTLGARGFPSDDRGLPVKGIARHPTIGDDVVIYAGATILGCITIGKGATIGGNVWLTHSVPPGTRVTQARLRGDSFEDGSGI
jgi:serine O-acetyltransferase